MSRIIRGEMEGSDRRTSALEAVSGSRLNAGITFSWIAIAAGILFYAVWVHDGFRYHRVSHLYQEGSCEPVPMEPSMPGQEHDGEGSPAYRYQVNGKTYISRSRRSLNVIWNWDGFREVNQEDMEKMGASGTCFHDPGDPSRAILYVGLPEPWFGCGFLVTAIELIAVANLVSSLKELRRRSSGQHPVAATRE